MLRNQSVHLFEAVDPSTGQPFSLRYLRWLPEAGQESDSRVPLILFLHGSGERGNDPEAVTRHGLPREIERGLALPAVVVSPQCPLGSWWSSEQLFLLVEHLRRELPLDDERLYLTGLSMGGFGTWALGAAQPELFAALAPVCGGGEVENMERLTHMPIWAFHGAQDEVVPLKRTAELVNALYNLGGNPRFTVYPEAGHDSWSETYSNPQLFTWLLAQRRRP